MCNADNVTKYLAAADVGATGIKLGLFTLDGRLCRDWSIPTDVSSSGSHILPDLCESLRKEAGDALVTGIGIDIPGAVDEQGVIRKTTNIGLEDINLNTELEKLMPGVARRCYGNDATVAALGELKFGAGRRYASTYLITLGTGVGGGYAADGRVTNGAYGAAGEIGHLIINPHEPSVCMCGRYGCLEQYASANGIVRLARDIIKLKAEKTKTGYEAEILAGAEVKAETETDVGSHSLENTAVQHGMAAEHSDKAAVQYEQSGARAAVKVLPSSTRYEIHIEKLFSLDIPEEKSRLEELEDFSSVEICALAAKGDRLSQYVIRIFGQCMGLAMSSISCTIDPEAYIIGGGMSKAGALITDAVREGFRQYAYPLSLNADVVTAELGNLAGLYGCAAMLMEA